MDGAEGQNGVGKECQMLHEGEVLGAIPADCKACHGCAFAHGPAPFEDKPDKVSCIVYTREMDLSKPREVLYDGAPCKFFRA